MGIGLAARALQGAEFRNGSRPAGYLATENKIDPLKAQEIGRRWAENYAGPFNSGKTAVLEQGLKYTLIEPRDLASLQMAELAKSNDADIARAFSIPLLVLGEVQSNRANTVESTRLLVSLCLRPMAVRVADALGLYLLNPTERAAGVRISIPLQSLTRGFGVELADSLSKLVLAGVLTRNEARADIDRAGDADAADLWQPVNVETVGQAQARQDRLNTPPPAPAAKDNVVPLVPHTFLEAMR